LKLDFLTFLHNNKFFIACLDFTCRRHQTLGIQAQTSTGLGNYSLSLACQDDCFCNFQHR
jgi:hypothetical protein